MVTSPTSRSDQATRPEAVLRHRSLPQSVHEILRSRILNNEMPSGTPLVELVLAAEFGVSRTTVRAAMRELQAERLIEISPRRGSVVTRMSEQDAREVCFARFTLEAAGLRELSRANRRQLADRMDLVSSTMAEAAERGDLPAIVAADTELHRLIVESSGHRLLVDMWSGLNAQMGALMRSSLDRQGIDLAESVRRHVELAQDFRDGTPSGVVYALQEHYVMSDAEAAALRPRADRG